MNALGNYLNKRLLRVSFSLMMGKKQSDSSSSNAGSAIQTVLREAEMHDAIVFFDECESMFAQRGSGGSGEPGVGMRGCLARIVLIRILFFQRRDD